MPKKYKINRKFTYDGKSYYIHADTEKEAAVKIALKLRDLEEGKVTINNKMTLNDWAIRCIETYKTGQKDITKEKYIAKVRHNILEHIGHMQLRSIKPLHCQQVVNLLTGKSKSHINLIYQAMNFIFEKAVENQLIYSNPAKGIIKPAGTYVGRRAITDIERAYILKVAKSKRKYYIYLLMLFCGCRPSEAAECMGKDICVINDINMLHIRGTKSVNADRYVPIPDELFTIIQNTPKNEYIAAYENGNPIKYQNRNRVWETFKNELNRSMGCKTYRNKLIPPYPVAPDLVPYCLRHTYCTDLAKAGVDLRIAQKLMGHSTITLTANIYTHVDSSDLIKAAQQLKEFKNSCTHGAPKAIAIEK